MKHNSILGLLLIIGIAMCGTNLCSAQFVLPVFQCTLTNKLDVFNWPGTPQETYVTGTREIYFICNSDNAENGDRIRAVWVADHTNGYLPPNTVISTQTHRIVKPHNENQTSEENLSLKKPAQGWPTGEYHVQLYVNGIEDKTYLFKVR